MAVVSSSINEKRVVQRSFAQLYPKKRVLILGDGTLAQDVGRALVFDRPHRYDVKGFLSHDPARIGMPMVDPGIIGTTDQLFELSEKFKIQMIAVCVEDRRGRLPLDSLLDAKSMGVEVVDGHRIYEKECGRLSVDELKPSFLIFSPGFRRKSSLMRLKRIVEALASLLGLVMLSPLLGLIALLVKWDSPGPILYKQTRVGHHGYPYQILKFRSMRRDAEAGGIQWAKEGDPRVTKIGAWLRKLRLDELPQLWCVVKGDMSLVGPRPERPHFVQDLRKSIPYYDLRHTVRPGITGWAQTRFHYAGSLEDSQIKLQYDLYYVKNLSIWLDLRILYLTLAVIWRGEGAR
jgi:sugar transferase (PEP-CTERM system associated)